MTTLNVIISPKGLASLTLNRPEVKNAFDENVITELTQTLETLAANPTIRALTIRGSGGNFCAGADLHWMRRIASYGTTENIADAARMAKLFSTLYHFPYPTIALVEGSTFGGGLGLLAACDMAFASDNSQFCFSEVKLGLIPAVITPYVIKAIGERNARWLFLTAEVFTPSIALQIGLIQAVFASHQFESETQKRIDSILNLSPKAQTAAKALLAAYSPLTQTFENLTVETIAALRASAEGKAGITAFLEKTTPPWIIP